MSAKSPLERVREALGPLERGARKRFSQNFLVDPNLLRSIAAEGDLRPGQDVLEVGPGAGALTAELLHLGVRLTAVEVDRDLVAYLRAEFAKEGLTVVEGDVLRVLPELPGVGEWRVVSNLPYAITSPFLARLVDWAPRVSRAVLLVQLEAARRVCAREGEGDRCSLGAFLQRYYVGRVARVVGPEVFVPRPRVHSAVLVLEPRAVVGDAPRATFERILRAAFGQRRKMLRTALASALPRETVGELLAAAGLSGEERAEQVSACAFEAMAATLASLEGGPPCEA